MITRYKCFNCYLIFNQEDMIDDCCPSCGDKNPKKMCPKDHICTCTTDIHHGVQYCAECGEAICPCGSHDCFQVSRVTGYLQEVKGFNAAKKQELKDRHHYNVT